MISLDQFLDSAGNSTSFSDAVDHQTAAAQASAQYNAQMQIACLYVRWYDIIKIQKCITAGFPVGRINEDDPSSTHFQASNPNLKGFPLLYASLFNYAQGTEL